MTHSAATSKVTAGSGSVAVAKLGLGTAQFGLDYGLTSPGAPVGEDEVVRILDLARASGIDILDTAALYGTSETVVGRALARLDAHSAFRIVTKLPGVGDAATTREALHRLDAALEASLARLGCSRLYGVVLHVPDDLGSPHAAAIIERLVQWRSQGRVLRIGSTIYDPPHIERVLALGDLDLVQLPLSILDQRLLAGGHLASLHGAGIEIHARSALLQGLVLMDPDTLPPHFANAAPALTRLRAAAHLAGVPLLSAAIGFVAALPEVTHVILGVHSRAHLAECIAAARTALSLPASDTFAVGDAELIDPRRWRRAS